MAIVVKTRVKILLGKDLLELEEEVNKYLILLPDIEIVSISHTITNINMTCSAILCYKIAV